MSKLIGETGEETGKEGNCTSPLVNWGEDV